MAKLIVGSRTYGNHMIDPALIIKGTVVYGSAQTNGVGTQFVIIVNY